MIIFILITLLSTIDTNVDSCSCKNLKIRKPNQQIIDNIDNSQNNYLEEPTASTWWLLSWTTTTIQPDVTNQQITITQDDPIIVQQSIKSDQTVRSASAIKCSTELDLAYCVNGGKCKAYLIANYTLPSCICAVGFYGERCEQKYLDSTYTTTKYRTTTKTMTTASHRPQSIDGEKKINSTVINNGTNNHSEKEEIVTKETIQINHEHYDKEYYFYKHHHDN